MAKTIKYVRAAHGVNITTNDVRLITILVAKYMAATIETKTPKSVNGNMKGDFGGNRLLTISTEARQKTTERMLETADKPITDSDQLLLSG